MDFNKINFVAKWHVLSVEKETKNLKSNTTWRNVSHFGTGSDEEKN